MPLTSDSASPNSDGWHKFLSRGPSGGCPPVPRFLPKLHRKCLKCISSHRVATSRLPQCCLHYRGFCHRACDHKRPRVAAFVWTSVPGGTSALPRHSTQGHRKSPHALRHRPMAVRRARVELCWVRLAVAIDADVRASRKRRLCHCCPGS